MMLELVDISVQFEGAPFLRGVNLSVARGEIVTLVGPSGSGKTTLLRVISGLEAPSAGRVLIDGRDVTTLRPHRRHVGMVFQDNQLFPHLTVAGNVGYALRIARTDRDVREQTVLDMLHLVGLDGFGDRRVDRLSGGEAKRVAVARSLAASPAVLLLDEPLTGLDAALHDRMLADLAGLISLRGTTVVHVTHDIAEAQALDSRIVDIRDIAVT
jgi:thiamine transport system ATP-binding protein